MKTKYAPTLDQRQIESIRYYQEALDKIIEQNLDPMLDTIRKEENFTTEQDIAKIFSAIMKCGYKDNAVYFLSVAIKKLTDIEREKRALKATIP